MHSTLLLAYRHHSTGSGLGHWLASIVVRAAVYRVMWGLPLPVVILAGLLALGVMHRGSARLRRSARFRG